MNQKTLTLIVFLCFMIMSLKPYKKEHTTQASTLKQKASLPAESEKLKDLFIEISKEIKEIKELD